MFLALYFPESQFPAPLHFSISHQIPWIIICFRSVIYVEDTTILYFENFQFQ